MKKIDLYGNCPSCNANWDGGEIPEAMQQHYAPPRRWMRAIAIYDDEADRTVAWKCPDCGHQVPR